MESYKSISEQILAKLSFVEPLEQTVEILDKIRHGTIGKSVENSVTGATWVTMAWDELRQLIYRVGLNRKQIAELTKQTNIVAAAAQTYSQQPNQQHFNQLLKSFQNAERTFDNAAEAFMDLRRFLSLINESINKITNAAHTASIVPVLGKYMAPLKAKLTPISAQGEFAREILKIAANAIERDKVLIKSMQNILSEALSADAYETASRAHKNGQLGHALTSFVELKQRWPQTTWATKATPVIAKLTTQIDELQRTMKSLKKQVKKLKEKRDKKNELPHWFIALSLIVALTGVGLMTRHWHSTTT